MAPFAWPDCCPRWAHRLYHVSLLPLQLIGTTGTGPKLGQWEAFANDFGTGDGEDREDVTGNPKKVPSSLDILQSLPSPLECVLILLFSLLTGGKGKSHVMPLWGWGYEKIATPSSPSLASSLWWKPVAILWAALGRGPCCKGLWKVESVCKKLCKGLTAANSPLSELRSKSFSGDPFDEAAALGDTLCEISRKRHPAKPHLDSRSHQNCKIINVCGFELLCLRVIFYPAV